MILNCLLLLYTFFKIGIMGFGGGYAMMSMIMVECQKLSITIQQFADLNALDMIVPGPIAINAATYVGYLHSGFWGALAATVGVSLPSFLLVTLMMYFIKKYRKTTVINSALSGIKPAAVGLIAAAAITIASGVLVKDNMTVSTLFTNPLETISFLLLGVFVVATVATIRFKINPLLLMLAAGVVGALWG